MPVLLATADHRAGAPEPIWYVWCARPSFSPRAGDVIHPVLRLPVRGCVGSPD